MTPSKSLVCRIIPPAMFVLLLLPVSGMAQDVKQLQEQIEVLHKELRQLELKMEDYNRELDIIRSPMETAGIAMIEHLARLCGSAHQYRIRPVALGGGGGSVKGYEILESQDSTAEARYEVAIQSDTMRFSGRAHNRQWGTISVKQAQDHRPIIGSWTRTGAFRNSRNLRWRIGQIDFQSKIFLGFDAAYRDTIMGEIRKLSEDAFGYRNRYDGDGSYLGYRLNRKQTYSRIAKYTAHVERDTVTITGSHFSGTVSAKIGSDGKPTAGGWKFTGDFAKSRE